MEWTGADGLPAYDVRLAMAFHLALGLDDEVDLHAGMGAALADLRALAGERPERPEPVLGQAICEAGLGRARAALDALEACWRLGFGGAQYPTYSYEVEEAAEGDVGAGDLMTVEFGPQLVKLLEAGLLFETGELARAEAALKALDGQIDADYEAHVHALLGRCRLAADDVEGATRNLGEALAWDRAFPPAHELRGLLWRAKGDAAKALRAYDRAARLDPYDPGFRLARARLLLELGRSTSAMRDIEAVEARIDAGYGDPAVIAEAAALRETAESRVVPSHPGR